MLSMSPSSVGVTETSAEEVVLPLMLSISPESVEVTSLAPAVLSTSVGGATEGAVGTLNDWSPFVTGLITSPVLLSVE